MTVTSPSKFDLKEIPERLQTWLAEVKEADGEVEVVEVSSEYQVATRSVIVELIELIAYVFMKSSESALYSPAENYDAVIEHDTDGMVERIVFKLRI